LDFTYAISSCTLLTAMDGCTTRMTVTELTSAMGAKSLAMSNDRLGLIAELAMLADPGRNSV
jgi:hypothetical protein